MAKRIFTVFFVSILSLGYLSVELAPAGGRRLASCENSIAEANILPLPSGLFGEVNNEALRKATLDYYLFLSKVEMQALAGRQSIQAMYSVNNGMMPSAQPTIPTFDPRGGAFATGFYNLRRETLPTASAQTVGASLPEFNIQDYSSGLALGSGVKPANGMLFAPYSQLSGPTPLIYYPTKSVFFAPVNAANHKIGTF